MSPLNLSDNYKLFIAIFFGLFLGFALVKSELSMPQAVRDALKLRNGKTIKTFMLWLALGAVLFFAARHLGMVNFQVRNSYAWGAVFGGIFCGGGLVLCAMTPVTAIAALATGKIYAVWVLCGMALAYPLVSFVSDLLSKTVYLKGSALDSPVVADNFFDLSNPALYAAGLLLIMIVAVQFTIGDSEE